MDRNWRTPVVEDQTARSAKSDSDDDDKTLVDEDEECFNVAEHDKLYVFILNPQRRQDANDSRSMHLLKWL